MKNELTGKVALVTGSSRGVGRSTAVALAKAATNVAVNDVHQQAEARAVCAEIEEERQEVESALSRYFSELDQPSSNFPTPGGSLCTTGRQH